MSTQETRFRSTDLFSLPAQPEDRDNWTEYEVEWTRVVQPTDTWVAAPTLDTVITLITCYPFRYVGTAPERFVVRARKVGEFTIENDAASSRSTAQDSMDTAEAGGSQAEPRVSP